MAWKNPYPLVEIVWDDATSNSESWVHLDEISAPARVNTTGFLVKETELAVTIAGSVAADEESISTVGNTMTIPRGMIVSRTALKIVKQRKS